MGDQCLDHRPVRTGSGLQQVIDRQRAAEQPHAAGRPGLLQHLCNEVGLRATAVRRLRLGRIGLAKMPAGQWRYLPVTERF